MSNFLENCQKMAQNGPKWPKMAQNGPKWPKMVKNGQKMAEF